MNRVTGGTFRTTVGLRPNNFGSRTLMVHGQRPGIIRPAGLPSQQLGDLSRTRRSEAGYCDELGGILFGVFAVSAIGGGVAQHLLLNQQMRDAVPGIGWYFTLATTIAGFALAGMTGWMIEGFSRVKGDDQIRDLTRGHEKVGKELADARATITVLQKLRNLYLTGVLSMTEGDRRGFLRMVTSQVILHDSPENVASLLAPYPEEAANLISGAKPEDTNLIGSVQKALAVMGDDVRNEIVTGVYQKTGGNEPLIMALYGYMAPTWGTPVIPEKLASAMDAIAVKICAGQLTGDEILTNAAKSSFVKVRFAAAFSIPLTNAALLRTLMDDADKSVSAEAASRAIRPDAQPGELAEYFKSVKPGVRKVVISHSNAGKELLVLALNDAEPENRMAAYHRVAPLFTAPDGLLKAAEQTLQHDILWEMAGHPLTEARVMTVCFNKVIEMSEKVVDKAEKGHYSDEQYSNDWIVDEPEVSHNIIPKSSVDQAVALLLSKGSSIAGGVLAMLKKDVADEIRAAYGSVVAQKIVDSFRATDPSKITPAQMQEFMTYYGGLNINGQRTVIQMIGVERAAIVLWGLPTIHVMEVTKGLPPEIIAGIIAGAPK